MSAHSSLDRDSFQALLANAFAVQESGIDPPSLSALVEIQDSIAEGEFNLDQAMHLIADRARHVANAAGVAIALLNGDQLVHRAASGDAATSLGQRMTAVLSISSRNAPRSEILRVENAQADSRIEAAICRQFGAMALLMVPIYRGRTVAGVLEVLFNGAHQFQDRETRTYQVMARLVGEALLRDFQLSNQAATQPTTVPPVVVPITSPVPTVRGSDRSPQPLGIPWIGWLAASMPALLSHLGQKKLAIGNTPKRALLDHLPWKMAAALALVALVITGWIAYDHHPAPPTRISTIGRANTLGQVASAPSNSVRVNPSPLLQNASSTMETNVVKPALKRVRIGQMEVDYVSDDVTVRRFVPQPAPREPRSGTKQVNRGEDVTVRYFAYTQAGVTGPATTEPPARRSLTESK